MNPDAVPFVVAGSVALAVSVVAKVAELLGTLWLRRIHMVGALAFVVTFILFVVWGLWHESIWRAAFAIAVVGCSAIAGWKHNQFEEIRDCWTGRDLRE